MAALSAGNIQGDPVLEPGAASCVAHLVAREKIAADLEAGHLAGPLAGTFHAGAILGAFLSGFAVTGQL